MKFEIPTEKEIRDRAKPHLDKLTLGMHFMAYKPTWVGQDADDLRRLILEICYVLDHVGPKALDETCAKRRQDLGMEPRRGQILAASQARMEREGSYRGLVEHNCDLLAEAARSNYIATWEHSACGSWRKLLLELIRNATVVLPNIIKQAEMAEPSEFADFHELYR
jgi:hypothetical protein